MAIRVKTGVVEQQKADASVFGYKQVFESPLSAVSDALNQTARAAGSVGDMFAKKQFAVNKSAANSADTQYGLQLNMAVAAVQDAYAQENDDAIAEAESALAAFDTSAANFTLDNFAPTKVSDPTFYQANGYTDRATELYQKAQLKLRALKPHHQLKNLLKTSRSEASVGLHQARQNNLGRTMQTDTFDTALTGIIALGNHEGLGGLTSPESVAAFKGDASGMVRQLFLHNIENARSIDEINHYVLKGIEQYGDQLDFVNERDRKALTDAAERRVDALTADGNKLLIAQNTAALDQVSQTFLNTLGQASDIESMVAAATNTSNVLMDIDPAFLSDADRDKYRSAASISVFFQPQQVENAAGEAIVTSPFRQGLLTALAEAKQNGDIPKYVLDDELLPNVRADDAGKLRQYVNTIALSIHKGLQGGDTSVLGLLTPDATEQAQLLRDMGYRDMPLFTGNSIPWSANDVESSSLHIAQALTDNTPAAVAQRGHNLMKNPNATKADRAMGLNYQLASMAASPEEAAKITKVVTDLTAASDRYVDAQHTPITQMFLGGEAGQAPETTEMTDSEVYNMYKVALQNGDAEEADAYLSLFQGLIVSVTDAFADDIYGVEKGGLKGKIERALSAETTVNILAGQDQATRARMLNTFFDKERELLTQRTGLTRVAYNDTKVTLLPSMLDAVDLEFRKPMNPILERILSTTLPFTDANVVFGISPETLSFLGRASYYDRQQLSARFRNGDYSVLPEQATNRAAEVYATEVAQSFDLNFTPAMVKNVDKFPAGFRQMVEEFGLATTRTKEEIQDILKDGRVFVGGTSYPLLDFSAKSWANNEIGVAVRYYDRTTGRYENLIDTNNEQVVITSTAAMNRLNSEGGWVPTIGATSRERVLREIERGK